MPAQHHARHFCCADRTRARDLHPDRARLTNREIGERLYLSEGSIKQYSNQIYSKLQIGGDTRTKRKRLIDLLNSGS